LPQAARCEMRYDQMVVDRAIKRDEKIDEVMRKLIRKKKEKNKGNLRY